MKWGYQMGTNRKKAHARWGYLANSPLVRKGFKSITADCVKIIRVLEEEEPLRRSKIIEKTGIPKGSIDRRLNHLRAIERIQLDKKKYRLANAIEEVKVSHDNMVAHSLKLVPALKSIARIVTSKYASEGEYISEQEKAAFIEYARAHLRFYPNLSKQIDNREESEEAAAVMEAEGNSVENVRLIEKTRKKAFELGPEIEREMLIIIHRIESRIALRGDCKMCKASEL